MNNINEIFSPLHLKTTILDLIDDEKRELAWELIDHYYSKAYALKHFDVLGYVAHKADKRDTYLKCAEAIYCLCENSEQLYIARANLYKAYNLMNYPEKAIFYIEKNLEITPDDFETLCHKASNLSLMGKKKESEELLEYVEKLYPEKKDKFDSGFSGKYLREGKTSKGLLSFLEAEIKEHSLFEKQLKMKKWNGVITPGKILYVDACGGIGDQIINIRFFEKIKKYGMRPILVSSDTKFYRDINSLLVRHGHEILTDKILIDRTQKWTSMMTLPGYLGLKEHELWSGTYLTPLKNPKNKIPGTKPKIGIKCSGNPYFAQDEYRKIPIEKMLKILPKEADIFYIDEKPIDHPGVIDLSHMINSWEDTLDIIDQMDCIVSSCTSLVHAAAAIGKTTFVAVPIAEYYIWTTTKKDGSSPWHGNNLFVSRQTKVRDWEEPLNVIENKLKDFLRINYG
jgi:tetratricopeptide (TPR) repeat protein